MTRVSPREGLREWAEGVGLTIAEPVWSRLETLVGLWQRYGRAFNLVGDLSADALCDHIREGLMAVRVAELAGVRAGAWLDIGSGAGVPGLVVATMRSHVVLVEPRERRAAFLKLAAATLNLSQTTVVRARVVDATWEKVASEELPDLKSVCFRAVTAKAVMPIDQWLSEGRRLVPNGVVVGHTTVAGAQASAQEASSRLVWGDRVVFGVVSRETSG